MAAPTDKPTPPETKPEPRTFLRWLLIAAAIAVLGVVAAIGWRAFQHVRKERIVARARTFIDKKDWGQAMIAVQWALQVNPRDVAVNRMMAELAETVGSPQALFWHRTVAELEPTVFANHLKWAESALRFKSLSMAEEALTNVDEAGKKTAAYHELAARVAQARNQPAEAEKHFAEAVRIEPGNAKYQFGLSSARLESPDAAVRNEARAAIEALKDQAAFRRQAHRTLITDAFRNKEWKKGFLLAADLQAIADAPFEDRMLLLDLLRKFERPELHAFLMDVQEQASSSPENIATVLNWLNRNTMALIAVDWSKRLPVDMRTRNPVPAGIAESYINLKDWDHLKPLVAEGNWEYFDFMRLALHARVLREQGDTLTSRNQWNAAVKAASGRPEALERLSEFAGKSNWKNEMVDVLWQVARSKSGQAWAFTGLQREYSEDGNARGLLNVATRMLEVNPKDFVAQNNVAALSLLLNTNMDRAQTLAREAYVQHPENAGVAATYAYALHLLGRTEEGLKIMRGLDEKLLSIPAFAGYFGILLVDSSTPAEARKYLEIAQKGRLLREESELVAKAAARLTRQSGEAPKNAGK